MYGNQCNVNPQIANFFNQVDLNRSGSISADELQKALNNGLGTAFNMRTIDLMICMFDRDMNGTMNLQEFSQLFAYVQQWQNCFQNYDRDRSVRKFDRHRRGSITFDDFILACVCLKR
ncbi:unnamed protein product [Heterobilharzia americana]|nr:unnamed protein product [Heterobilharzia americana]